MTGAGDAGSGGSGWVYRMPEGCQAFSGRHPIQSGICVGATDIRPMASVERLIYAALEGFSEVHPRMQDQIDRLAAELAAARAGVETRTMERGGARHMLRRLEWSVDTCGLRTCPACSGKQPGQSGMRSLGGHTVDCSMATALGIPMGERISHGSARTPGGSHGE